MRNLLAFLSAAVLTVAGVGWYLGWYQVQSSSPTPGHKAVHIDINSDKIDKDLQRGTEKVQEAIDKNLKEEKGKVADGANTDTLKQIKPQ